MRRLLSCEELTTEAMIKPMERKATGVKLLAGFDKFADEDKERNQIRRNRHPVELMGEEKRHDDGREIKQDAGGHRRDEQRQGRDRRHFVAAQDIGFAIHDRAHPRAEKAVPENAQRQHHRDHLIDGGSLFGVEVEREDEEKDEREEVVEKQHGLVPQRELQVDPHQGEERFHLIAEFFAG